MSASTVSITANPSTATRRRAVEKKPVDFADTNNFSTAAAAAASPAAESGRLILCDTSIRGETRDAVAQIRKPLANNTASARRPSNSARRPSSKPEKPRWKTILSIFLKNFALGTVLIGWIYMGRELAFGKRNSTATGDDVPVFQGNSQKMEEFVTSMAKTVKMMQMQVDVIDRKIGEEIGSVKREINKKIEAKTVELEEKLKELDGRTMNLEKFTGELGWKMEKWMSREELDEFLEEFKKEKSGEMPSLDDLRAFAKKIVEKEIEKHAADGMGRVDYALRVAGGSVLKHSEPVVAEKGSGVSWLSLTNRLRVHSDAENMLRPSFGEPGQCFALKGNHGFVQIRLRTGILPEAITLEHVAEAVAFDRSSAPKDCRVSGWKQGQDLTELADKEKMFRLTKFTYDLEKSNVQTFDVVDSSRSRIVDTIRFDFTSNHGSPTHTCIYRIRVHGSEPNSVSMLPTQS